MVVIMEDASTDRHHLFLEFHAKLKVTLGIKNMHLNVAISVGYIPNYFLDLSLRLDAQE